MSKYIVDIIEADQVGVTGNGSRERIEEYVQLSQGEDVELGLEISVTGYEVCDSTGEVVAYIFLTPMEGTD